MELLLLILILLSILFLSTLNHHRKNRLPPGPVGLPIVGNLFEIGPKPHESLAKLAQKHGPFMTIRLGSITSIVASTPDAAREILQRKDDACSSRPIPDVVNALKHPKAAILWMPPNQTWRAMRKALNIYLTIPHKLDAFSHVRENVVEEMLAFVRNKENVDIGKLAFSATLNQLSYTFISQNVTSYDSDNIKGFKMAIETAMEVQGKFNVADIFPVLKPLDPQNIRRQAKAAYKWLDEVIHGYVSERLKQGESRFGHDLLDSLLEYSRENEERFNLIQLKALLVITLDNYIVPANTQIIVNAWAIAREPRYWESPSLFMPERFLRNEIDYKGQDFEFIPFGSGRRRCPGMALGHRMVSLMVASFVYHFDWKLPHAKEEMDMNDIFVREEVDQVVGKDGKVKEAEVLGLPYLQAVIKETMQLHVLAPLMAPHKTQMEIKLGNYIVPANTQIIVNAWAIEREPSYWESTSLFMRERFLRNEIDYKGQYFEFYTIRSGRRRCPGMALGHRMKLTHAKEEMDMNDIFSLALQKAAPLVATPIPLHLK
ncbi:hypothetical protein M8C21_033456 [Ambrosia artemisiifolia]|uniref:Cytochrome P450 n=1 Tax=Ambrosia artemisiifolia TaxID=4212 RepID=A0AAD5CS45_AMBAR|nr:hypothetical protein M8C21_033456 [Ambrosia artemisiifolia]